MFGKQTAAGAVVTTVGLAFTLIVKAETVLLLQGAPSLTVQV
ncbi:hypothetical protein NU08_4271 [Flavobacterium anhuiense]|uniref:Uncharacterized protein n=1 Tax=Flavobacterium anhuiense TaxID=459526 RepID=A0A444VSX9_9FLAO|nr:hypothetical protein NU08_4271 [Flavobacterium anhuiense]